MSKDKEKNPERNNSAVKDTGMKDTGTKKPEKKGSQKKDMDQLEKQKRENAKKTEHKTTVGLKEMGEHLKELMKEEIEEYKKREKTREAEMIAIFAAHNYYANGFTPVELRTTLEDLGPTYVKIGQIMSSRVDLLPEAYCKELEKLRQNVKQLDPKVARAVIEQETGKKIKDLFTEFKDKPLGSASIGQVHYAVLKDGTKVVVKVQRPLIADMMRKDFVLLKKLAGLVNVVSDNDGDQTIDLVSVLNELEKVTNDELDFRVEANNTKFFKENCIEDETRITCPTVIDELTTERIFTMTYVDGYTLSHPEKLAEDGLDPVEIGGAIAGNFVHQVLDVGTFHADPHQGNIMISNGVPYWIDFGMIGSVTEKDIDNIQSIVLSMLSLDAEGLVNGVAALGATSAKTNRDKLMEDAEAYLEKYAGTTNIADLDMSEMFDEVMDLASKHHISLPGQFTMLGRAVLAIEGVIERLCPELDLVKLLSDKMIERTKQNFDLKKSLLDAGKDLLASGKKTAKIPVLLADTLTGLSRGKTKINMELQGIDEPLENIAAFIKNIMLIVIACVLFIGSCILASVDLEPKTDNGMPLISAVGITFSIALTIFSVIRLSKKKE